MLNTIAGLNFQQTTKTTNKRYNVAACGNFSLSKLVSYLYLSKFEF